MPVRGTYRPTDLPTNPAEAPTSIKRADSDFYIELIVLDGKGRQMELGLYFKGNPFDQLGDLRPGVMTIDWSYGPKGSKKPPATGTLKLQNNQFRGASIGASRAGHTVDTILWAMKRSLAR